MTERRNVDRRVDPDEEWARWVLWVGEGPGAPSIWDDVVAMMAARQIWEGFQILYQNAPSDARRNGIFQSWVVENYVRRQAMAIRRQTDTDRDVVSLAHLIDQVRRYPDVLSRERYAKRTAGWQSRAESDHFFDQMVGAGRDHIDKYVAKADLAKLRSGTRKVVDWADNEIAHYNQAKGQFGVGVSFAELNGGIDTIVDLAVRYRELILGSSMSKSVSIWPWMQVFRVAWIPDEEQLQRIFQAVDNIDRRRLSGEKVEEED